MSPAPMDPEQMARLVTKVRRIEASLGDGVKDIQRCEEWEATYSRRSISVMRDVAVGQELVAEDLALLRPGTGLHPKRWDEVLGRKAKRAIAAREPLQLIGRKRLTNSLITATRSGALSKTRPASAVH